MNERKICVFFIDERFDLRRNEVQWDCSQAQGIIIVLSIITQGFYLTPIAKKKRNFTYYTVKKNTISSRGGVIHFLEQSIPLRALSFIRWMGGGGWCTLQENKLAFGCLLLHFFPRSSKIIIRIIYPCYLQNLIFWYLKLIDQFGKSCSFNDFLIFSKGSSIAFNYNSTPPDQRRIGQYLNKL